jgi:hypothetical protein
MRIQEAQKHRSTDPNVDPDPEHCLVFLEISVDLNKEICSDS